MKQKELLLWVIAIVALVISVFSIVQSRIKPLQSDASSRNLTPQLEGTVTLNGGGQVGDGCIVRWRQNINSPWQETRGVIKIVNGVMVCHDSDNHVYSSDYK